MKPRMLSREEEAELAQSNKKVKDIHHAEFNGAYATAFDLTDQMEEDMEAEEENEDNRDFVGPGRVAVKLSRETKKRIRGAWSNAIIIKLVGRTVGFNYLQSKLLQLWRPTSKMDCVDLTCGFFLVRFYSNEDLDNVIQKGPWFIGDHFLSLRPWEPFFKPSMANISLVVVWVRLNELPIKLYETEVLKQIGNSIGRVLRIYSQTAMKARGKYARLCIQIHLNKTLINSILIDRFEQGVTYEGIQRLCFSCGRVRHIAGNRPKTY
ncbi:uncharacterized protein LOC142614035 [Castanea sativa]|uniref:uncharacterized protein LOC142614035 n=1 Tax=Castanea sativa TaxID=21020 RepID=UPI003F6529E5